MKWFLVSSDPVTCESYRLVETESGERGFVAVGWSRGSARLHGPVISDLPNPDPEQQVTVLDSSPEF